MSKLQISNIVSFNVIQKSDIECRHLISDIKCLNIVLSASRSVFQFLKLKSTDLKPKLTELASVLVDWNFFKCNFTHPDDGGQWATASLLGRGME